METTKQGPQEEQQPESQQQHQFAADAPEPTAARGDLSKEIAAAVEKERGDRVRVTWIYGTFYRCNWWAPASKINYDNPGMQGMLVTTHVVRKSKFLSVTKVGDGLLISERPSR